MKSLTLFDEAARLAREQISKPPIESISIQSALGRIVGRPVCASLDMPPFDRSMMDGYAVRHTDTLRPLELHIVDDIPAGNTPAVSVGPMQAARCMTGAPVPDGADCIARFEWCEEANGVVRVLRPVQKGESIQLRGEDGRIGDVLIPAGTRLSGRHLSVLQSFGVRTLDAVRPLQVSILTTGSELVHSLESPLQSGQIYASNHLFLQDALQQDGCEMRSVQFVEDDPLALEQALRTALDASDIVLTTGGVSVGTHDYMREVAARCGVSVVVEHVWMRPGSPFLVGRKGNAAVFAMSGNPAACFVQFEALVRPAIQAGLGMTSEAFMGTARLAHAVDLKPIKHVRIFRGVASVRNASLQVDVQMTQSAGVISNLVQANCLIRLDESSLPAGSVVPIRWIGAGDQP